LPWQEVTYYSNVFTLLAMMISMTFSGDLYGAGMYALSSQKAAIYLTIYTLLAYCAISLHMTMVKQFGSVSSDDDDDDDGGGGSGGSGSGSKRSVSHHYLMMALWNSYGRGVNGGV